MRRPLHNLTIIFSGVLASLALEDRARAQFPGVVLRISHALADPRVVRQVSHTKPVRQVVLGTQVRGECETTGTVTMEIDRREIAAPELVFTFQGQSVSRTVGYNGPAIIHSRAVTDFVCRRRIHLDGESFSGEPCQIDSQTRLVIEGIGTTRHGLAGRIVRRVASRRVAEAHATAEAHAASDARQQVASGFDHDLDVELAKAAQDPALIAIVTGKPAPSKPGRLVTFAAGYIEVSLASWLGQRHEALPEHSDRRAPVEVWAPVSPSVQRVAALLQSPPPRSIMPAPNVLALFGVVQQPAAPSIEKPLGRAPITLNVVRNYLVLGLGDFDSPAAAAELAQR